jgi:hypothetical protein
MTVENLIKELQKMPPKATVHNLWDGALRSGIDALYKTEDGRVGTYEHGDSDCYYDHDRPIGAPSSEDFVNLIISRYFKQ